MIVNVGLFHNDLCASPTLNDGASSTALMIVNVGLFHNDLCASPTLFDGASSTALMIVNVGLLSQRPVRQPNFE